MIELKELLKMDIEEIISSVHSLTLLKYYSKLYLNGGQPRTCAASQKKYYLLMKKDYQMKKEIIERKCVPAFQGRRYIPGVFKDGKLIAGHLHIMGSTLTDAQAIMFLELGVLTKKDFAKLPDMKEEPKSEIKLEPESTELTTEEIYEIIKRDDYKELSKAAKDLGLIKTKASKESIIKALKYHIN